MVNKKNIYFVGLLLSIICIYLILAAPNAPTNLVFNNNATPNYDEGVFTLNWTSGAGDAESNYSIYVFSNSSIYLVASNNSVTGYSFSNTTEANYTFIVEAINETGFGTNSSNISIYVDTTAPVITLPEYVNGTKKKNTESLILNISVTDATSGLTNGVCLIDVNGTNQSVSISDGWCNSSSIALTGLSDGNQTINVWVNDSTNNIGLNNSYVVQIDTTAPVITLPFYTNATKKKNTESLILNISVTDATSGLTNGVCLIDVNGTNQSVSISSGWCNASNIALTGLTDGNKTIKVWVNDSTNNIGLNDSYVVQIDTTAPVITLNLSSAVTDSLVLSYSTSEGSCTVNRGTISTADSTIVEYRLDCETSYSYTLNCTDSNGNSATLTESFSTSSCSSGGGSSSSGSTSSPSYWSNTFLNENVNFINGVTKELSLKNRMRVELNGADHYVGVMELTSTTAKISVNSVPQDAVFSIGESKKFDVDNNGFYDVLITLNSIINNKASVTALPIYEKIVSEVVEEAEVVTPIPTTEVPEEKVVPEEIVGPTTLEKIITNLEENSLIYGILIGLIILALIGYSFRKKNKKLKKLKR